MKKRIAIALLTVAAPAFAQNAPKPIPRSEYIKNLDNRFAGMDANHDGTITLAELTAQQQRELEMAKQRLQQQIQARFNQLDTNKNGQLSLQEFLAATPPIRTNETPQDLLQRFDANRDGKVTLEEFRAPEVAKFNKIDTNHDGTVTPAELQAAAGKK